MTPEQPDMRFKAIALDAMGVVYTVADDLRDLLIPFLRVKGCTTPDNDLIEAYRAWYRRGAPASGIWRTAGFDAKAEAQLEPELLGAYELAPGVVEFLEAMRDTNVPVYVLSNDVAGWASRRRQVHGIDAYFKGGVVSGEIGMYKPDPTVFERFCRLLPCAPADCLFVDDRDDNLDAASLAGLATALFGAEAHKKHRSLPSFDALREFVQAGDPV